MTHPLVLRERKAWLSGLLASRSSGALQGEQLWSAVRQYLDWEDDVRSNHRAIDLHSDFGYDDCPVCIKAREQEQART